MYPTVRAVQRKLIGLSSRARIELYFLRDGNNLDRRASREWMVDQEAFACESESHILVCFLASRMKRFK